ncbi:MAG: sce7726 family protein [Streptosporangiaceae bacterium]
MLRRQHRGCRTVYRREWSIGVGATRVDVAAINGRIIGCEVKSARDNFSRLPSQVELYSAILDTAVLAVEGPAAAERARHLLPNWWGIWLARPTLRGAVLDVVREPGSNLSPNPLSIAQLLWRDEAYSVLDRRGLSGGLRKATRWRLWETLAGQLPLHELQHEVRNTIKARPEW